MPNQPTQEQDAQYHATRRTAYLGVMFLEPEQAKEGIQALREASDARYAANKKYIARRQTESQLKQHPFNLQN